MIKTRGSFFLSVGLLAVLGAPVYAAQPPSAVYDPAKTFAPLTLPDPVNSCRSSNGAPGPDYWQNSADYEIHANLDTAAKQLGAAEVISYVNNSPEALPWKVRTPDSACGMMTGRQR
jgi:hypothetical protein